MGVAPAEQATQCTWPLLFGLTLSLLLLSLLLFRWNSASATDTDTEANGDTDDERDADISPLTLALDNEELEPPAGASHTLQYISSISDPSPISSGAIFQVAFGSLLCLKGLVTGDGEELLDVPNPLEGSESEGRLVEGNGAGNGSLCVVCDSARSRTSCNNFASCPL